MCIKYTTKRARFATFTIHLYIVGNLCLPQHINGTQSNCTDVYHFGHRNVTFQKQINVD